MVPNIRVRKFQKDSIKIDYFTEHDFFSDSDEIEEESEEDDFDYDQHPQS